MARDCPSNLMNAMGASKQGDCISVNSLGDSHTILVAEESVSLISFSGQSLPLLSGRIAQFRDN